MVELGDLKRDDDKTFRDIVVTVDGSPQDLGAEGWEVAVQFRHYADSPIVVTPTIDAGALAQSRVRLSLPRAVTKTMAARTWVGDVQVTGPAGRHSSTTFTVVIEPDVTRVDS